MRQRTLWLGGANLFSLGLALGLVLAANTGQRAVDNRAVPSGAVAAAPTPAAATPGSSSNDTKLKITVATNGSSGGKVVIEVPPPEPEICAPVHIRVDVGQTTLAACSSANYLGPIVVTVANPAIASVTTSNDRMVPRYLVVTGRDAGTTIVRVSYVNGPTTSYPITVSPT